MQIAKQKHPHLIPEELLELRDALEPIVHELPEVARADTGDGHLKISWLCVSRRKKGSSVIIVVLIVSTWPSTNKRGRIPPERKIKEKP
jgi:hypothetical protein